MKLPKEVITWLASLPEPHRSRETEVANRNWARIINFVKRK